ncbi:hypothetical protein BGX34_000783 [Mortierella sp. NVP85]|nr:hypothetical protein BGX34_000783 [Mortierella sp. NVP85]
MPTLCVSQLQSLFCRVHAVKKAKKASYGNLDIFNHSHRFRFLTIVVDPDFALTPSGLASRVLRLLRVQKAGLQAEGPRNLISLSVRARQIYTLKMHRDIVTRFYRLVGIVLLQNPEIQELEWDAGGDISTAEFVDSVLVHTNTNLRRLSIYGDHQNHEIRIFEHLIRTQGVPKIQENTPAIVEAGSGGNHHAGDNKSRGLEDLVLKNVRHGSRFLNGGLRGTEALRHVPGVLSIRALTLVDYEVNDVWSYLEPLQARRGKLMAILERCPNLERLCVTFDISGTCASFDIDSSTLPSSSSSESSITSISTTSTSPTTSATSSTVSSTPTASTAPTTALDPSYNTFFGNLKNCFRYTDSPRKPGLFTEDDDFVDELYRNCPKLCEIEFGIAYQFTTAHWTEMIRRYGPQLRALSVWGNVCQFDASVFMAMIGPPFSHPSRDQLHCMTRLNINGMNHLHDCAWMALQHLPRLKEFRARDVPLDARHLIMKDGWICKGLEVLEILILVPKHPSSPKEIQHWCYTQEQWVPVISNRIEKYDAGHRYNDWIQTKPPLKEIQPTKKRRSLSEDEDEGMIKRRKRTNAYCKEVQFQVCEMLGRLTQLRELRIEGERDIMINGFEWDCLELTLETGLDHLASLQNLETLMVYTLDEELGGKEELEWIARNWVYHGMVYNVDPFLMPSLKFKKLIGISGRGVGRTIEETRANVGWLQEQCPALEVRVM